MYPISTIQAMVRPMIAKDNPHPATVTMILGIRGLMIAAFFFLCFEAGPPGFPPARQVHSLQSRVQKHLQKKTKKRTMKEIRERGMKTAE